VLSSKVCSSQLDRLFFTGSRRHLAVLSPCSTASTISERYTLIRTQRTKLLLLGRMVVKKNGKLFIGMKTILFTLALLFPFAAHAQDKEEDRKIIYKERTEIDFESVDVTGELIKPAGALIINRKKATFPPLIKLREDWNDELKRTIDKVK